MKSWRLRVGSLLAIALLIRLAFVVLSGGWTNPLRGEPTEEVRLAQNLAQGHGFVSPFWAFGDYPSYPSAHSPPGFPYLLSGILRVWRTIDADSIAPYQLMIVFGALVGSLAVVLLAITAGRTAGTLGFWVVGLLAAVWPTLVRGSTYLWDTPFVLVAIGAGFWLASSSPPRMIRPREVVAVGVLSGTLALFNPIVGPFLGVAIVAWVVAGVGIRRAVLPVFAIGTIALACSSPWLIRNAVVFHRFIPIRNNFGFELWVGNHPGTNGTTASSMPWHPMDNPTERELAARVGDDAYMRLKADQALAGIRAEPGRFLTQSVHRVSLFWFGDLTRPNSILGISLPIVGGVNVTKLGLNGLLLLLALGGVLTWRSTPGRWLSWFGIATLPVVFYITHVSTLYRSIIDSVLCLLAGLAVAGLLERLLARRRRRIDWIASKRD